MTPLAWLVVVALVAPLYVVLALLLAGALRAGALGPLPVLPVVEPVERPKRARRPKPEQFVLDVLADLELHRGQVEQIVIDVPADPGTPVTVTARPRVALATVPRDRLDALAERVRPQRAEVFDLPDRDALPAISASKLTARLVASWLLRPVGDDDGRRSSSPTDDLVGHTVLAETFGQMAIDRSLVDGDLSPALAGIATAEALAALHALSQLHLDEADAADAAAGPAPDPPDAHPDPGH